MPLARRRAWPSTTPFHYPRRRKATEALRSVHGRGFCRKGQEPGSPRSASSEGVVSTISGPPRRFS